MSDAAADPSGSAEPAAAAATEAIWRAVGRQRGVLGSVELGEIMLLLLYLRSRPAWETLDPRGPDVEHAVAACFPDGQGLKVVRPLLDSVRRVEQMRRLDELLGLVDSLGPDRLLLAQVFSGLLERILSVGGRKTAGEFDTPRSVTELATLLLKPVPSDRILDPCCKSGGFPTTMLDRMPPVDGDRDLPVIAISDYNERSRAAAYLSLRLRGVTPLVLQGAAEILRAGAAEERYDVITANPPFSLSHWSDGAIDEKRWRYGPPPPNNSNFAWLQYVASSLRDGGRAAVVLPNGTTFSEKSQEWNIRRAMVDDQVVSAVVALPGQMFSHTAIPATLWLLRRSTAGRGDILFVDASDLGVVHRNHRTLTGDDLHKVASAYHDWLGHRLDDVDGFAAAVPVDRIAAAKYVLNPRAYVARSHHSSPDLERVRELTDQLDRLRAQAQAADDTVHRHLLELKR